jgi:hypothetical protein
MDPDALIHAYLGRVESAASGLEPERRAELVADLRDHIALALRGKDPIDETAVRRVIERLGAPEEIVAEETQEAFEEPTRPASGVSAWWRDLSTEGRALLFLTVGSLVLPFIGAFVGLWLVSGSSRWSLAQKRTAGLIILVLASLPAILVLPAVVAGELTWVLTSGGFSLPLIPLAGLTAAAYLMVSSAPAVARARGG